MMKLLDFTGIRVQTCRSACLFNIHVWDDNNNIVYFFTVKELEEKRFRSPKFFSFGCSIPPLKYSLWLNILSKFFFYLKQMLCWTKIKSQFINSSGNLITMKKTRNLLLKLSFKKEKNQVNLSKTSKYGLIFKTLQILDLDLIRKLNS